MTQKCGLAECDKPVLTAYCIAGLPDVKYCSRTCVDVAFEAYIKGRRKALRDAAKPEKKTANPNVELAEDIIPGPDTDSDSEESSNMESAITKEFGDATIVRHVCDRKGCGKPVTLGWKGRDGEYCSNTCFKLAEREKEAKTKMTTDTNTIDTPVDDSPVTAGKKSGDKKKKAKKPDTKKAAKPAAAKPAAKPEAKAKSKANGSNGSAIGNQVIHLTKKDSDMRGKRQQIFKLIKSGMTVSQLQDAAARKMGDDSYKARALAVLRTCVDNDLCTVK
jgi:hypothetical protein